MKTYLTFIIFGLFSMIPQVGFGQLVSVSGFVKDGFSGLAIENATVYESLSGIGTITNKDGYYRLLLNKGKQNLKISSNGMESFSAAFTLKSDTIMPASLMPVINLQGSRVVDAGKEKKDASITKNSEKKR